MITAALEKLKEHREDTFWQLFNRKRLPTTIFGPYYTDEIVKDILRYVLDLLFFKNKQKEVEDYTAAQHDRLIQAYFIKVAGKMKNDRIIQYPKNWQFGQFLMPRAEDKLTGIRKLVLIYEYTQNNPEYAYNQFAYFYWRYNNLETVFMFLDWYLEHYEEFDSFVQDMQQWMETKFYKEQKLRKLNLLVIDSITAKLNE